MKTTSTILVSAIVVLAACGGKAVDSVGGDDAGNSSADAGRVRQVEAALLRGPCSASGRCPSGQSCVRLTAIDPSITDPICVASSRPCDAVICEEGLRCSFGDETPYPMFCSRI